MEISGNCHVAAIPYPGRGHINPMMNLCRLLATKNLLITVIVTEEWLGLISSGFSPLPPNLRLRSIPNVLPSELTRGADFAGFIQAVFSKMEAPVDQLLERLEPPVDFVVTDSILPWAAEICKRRNVPVSSLWTESAAVFWALYRFGCLYHDGQQPVDFSGKEDEALAYIPKVSTPHFAGILSNTNDLYILMRFVGRFSWFPTAQSLLFTSFYKLESRVIDTIKSNLSLPIYPLGPSIPYMTLADPPIETDTKSSHFKWLDSQPNCSVLYISLGSFLSISSAQVDEMVMGLNTSGVRYLWVAREEHQQFKELNGEVGLVVPWCDQLRVLCHPSIGGFLTHCGWNSTLEGVFAGVPMLTFPLIWDQYSNSKQIVDNWKIGVRLKDEEAMERVIVREEVARMVRELMDLDAEESKGMRRRAAELKEWCQEALGEGGSSSTNLDAFVRDMISKKRSIDV